MNRLSQQVAAHSHARQLRVCRRADAAANAVDRAVHRVWRAVLAAMRGSGGPVFGQVYQLFHALPQVVRRELAGELARTAEWGYKATRANLARTLPVGVLREAVRGQGSAGHSVGAVGGVLHIDAEQSVFRLLHEDEGPGSDAARFSFSDLFAPFRDATAADPADDLTRPDLLSLLFPAPSAERVNEIVYASGWWDRIASGTGLAAPAALAQQIAMGMMLGHSQAEIARQILPVVQGVQSSARRIARTESLRVAAAVQMDAHRSLGPLVIGYQIRATLDKNTRPWHAKRDGTIYYADPGPGQKGYGQMPHPPEEAQDPSERPPGTPQTAWNCRCYLTPVLRQA